MAEGIDIEGIKDLDTAKSIKRVLLARIKVLEERVARGVIALKVWA